MEIHNQLNKTMKIKRNENIFVSVRATDTNASKKPTNYLSPTVSSINKQSPKFVKRPTSASSNISNLSRTTPSLKRKESILSSKLNKSFDYNVYYDNLNHFTNNENFGYDIYDHFS